MEAASWSAENGFHPASLHPRLGAGADWSPGCEWISWPESWQPGYANESKQASPIVSDLDSDRRL